MDCHFLLQGRLESLGGPESLGGSKAALGRKERGSPRLQSCSKEDIVVQSFSHVQLFATSWTAAHQASLSFTISQSLGKAKAHSESQVLKNGPAFVFLLCLVIGWEWPVGRAASAQSCQWEIQSQKFEMSVSYDPLEKGKATHSTFWPGDFRGLYSPWGGEELDTTERLALSLSVREDANS